jgi:hypothetical protein
MRNCFYKCLTGYLPILTLFAVALLALCIRNPDPFFSPILFAEDGSWLGMAFLKGWPYTFFNAKQDYLVLGNLILLWIAETSSKLFCGNSLVCLPQSIAVVSLAFFASVATLLFVATRNIATVAERLVLYVMLLVLPLGDSSNEIFGRACNIGFMFVFISILLAIYRENLKSVTQVRIVDVMLIISAATNPVVILLIMIYLSWRLYSSKEERNNDLFLLAGTCLVAVLVAYRMMTQDIAEVKGVLNPENIIEVAVARSILYPLLFPYYPSLSNFSTITLFIAWLSFIVLVFKQSSRQTRAFIAYNLVALTVYWALTIAMRQSLTQQMGGYRTTFPDRYFMGMNAIVMLITLIGAFSLVKSSKLIVKTGAILLLTALAVLYGTNAPWIFETNNTRMPLMTAENFFDQLCANGKTLTQANSEQSGLAAMPVYFRRKPILIPQDMLLEATEKLDCHALKPLNISDLNWSHGVARNWSGLVLAASADAKVLQSGKSIRFANGEVRSINRVESAGKFMNVFLEGMPLNGNLIGYPNKLEVIE